MTHRPILAILALILASLACGTYITPTPAPQASPSPTASVSPQPPTLTAAAPTSTEDVQTAKVVRPIVRVHKEADGAEIIGYLQEGDSVTVIECVSSWCKISTDVLSGYVWQGCISQNPDGLKCEADR